MAKCWTCGTHVGGYRYTCSSCESLKELKNLQETIESYGEDLDYIAQVQQQGFKALNDTLSSGLSEIGSAIEWGFGEISWQLQQQTDVLRSIDHTLKTPSETKANEWRLQAEELRRRGVLDESEEFFLKALNEYRLDYRIYVGLAETYLQMNKFDKAKVFLEKSLPHAPKEEIDYKSYSYRLIGHIYACEEDYDRATSTLQTSIELSPKYEDGYYDYAQYCAQTRNIEVCLSSLQKAILSKPLYWYLAHKEQNFDPVRSEAGKLLTGIKEEAYREAKDAIVKSGDVLKEAREAVSRAEQALIVSRDKGALKSSIVYNNAEAKLKIAKDKVASGDYVALLEAKPIAEESHALGNEAMNTANRERIHYEERRREKVKNVWKGVPVLILWLLGSGLGGGLIGRIGGCTIGLFIPGKGTEADSGAVIGYLIGIVIGFIGAILYIQGELK